MISDVVQVPPQLPNSETGFRPLHFALLDAENSRCNIFYLAFLWCVAGVVAPTQWYFITPAYSIPIFRLGIIFKHETCIFHTISTTHMTGEAFVIFHWSLNGQIRRWDCSSAAQQRMRPGASDAIPEAEKGPRQPAISGKRDLSKAGEEKRNERRRVEIVSNFGKAEE